MIHLYPLATILTDIFDQNVNQEIIRKKVPAKAVEISGALELEPKAVSTGPQFSVELGHEMERSIPGVFPPQNRSLSMSAKSQI